MATADAKDAAGEQGAGQGANVAAAVTLMPEGPDDADVRAE